jgi:hypothetical protein
MGQANQIGFSYKEIVELLVKKQGIHDGIWGLYVKFGLGAINIGEPSAPKVLTPTAIVSVQEIGLQKFDEENNLTVDAAVFNPAPADNKAKTQKKRGS